MVKDKLIYTKFYWGWCRFMSYQTSIHFDPTRLLMIKNEVENSIQLVENAVEHLVEDKTLAFGIDDALIQIKQCAQVLHLIEMPLLANIAAYSAELMQKIMQNPADIKTDQVVALTEGTTMLKKYIGFICLREVHVPQFLLDTLNVLEIALKKPISSEGAKLENYDISKLKYQPQSQITDLEKTIYIHKLYKYCLNNILQQQESDLDLQGLEIVGKYLVLHSHELPSMHYWKILNLVFENFEQIALNQPRYRSLIEIEKNIALFYQHPEQFQVTSHDLANTLSLAISLEHPSSQTIREELKIGDEILTDIQLTIFAKQLYGPDYETIHKVVELISLELKTISRDVEYNYQNMTAEKVEKIKLSIQQLSNIFSVLNLQNIDHDLKQLNQNITLENIKENETFLKNMMKSILNAINFLDILERNYTSNHIKIKVNNTQISLDHLDHAYEVLCSESKNLIEETHKNLVQYLSEPNTELLNKSQIALKELSGAALFVNVQVLQQSLIDCSNFILLKIHKNIDLSSIHIEHILDVLASLDLMIDNLQNKQPILHSMFNVALASSHNLKH